MHKFESIDSGSASKINSMISITVAFLIAVFSMHISSTKVSAAPILESAQSFSVLGGSTVTNTGGTTIYGNIGVYPGSSITGFPPGSVEVGEIGVGPNLAQSDALAAYNILKGLSFTSNLTGQDLGGRMLTPGVYHFDSSAQLTGDLLLDFFGNPNADFVFQIGSTLMTASDASVRIINGSSLSGVYWQVGSSATLGSSTSFAGNILADQSITMNSAADILGGRAIALNGAVTLDNNRITNDSRSENFGTASNDFGSYGYSGGSVIPVTPVPEPGTLLLMGSGLAGLAAFRKRFRIKKE